MQREIYFYEKEGLPAFSFIGKPKKHNALWGTDYLCLLVKEPCLERLDAIIQELLVQRASQKWDELYFLFPEE